MKKILITGVSGLLGLNVACTTSSAKPSSTLFGHSLCSAAFPIETSAEQYKVAGGFYKSHRVASPSIVTSSLDLIDRDKIRSEIRRIKPDVILHTAGLTN